MVLIVRPMKSGFDVPSWFAPQLHVMMGVMPATMPKIGKEGLLDVGAFFLVPAGSDVISAKPKQGRNGITGGLVLTLIIRRSFEELIAVSAWFSLRKV